MRRTADVQTVADLTGEVFVAAFVAWSDASPAAGRDPGRPDGPFGIARNQPAHYTVAANRCQNAHRRKLAMERVVVDDDTAEQFVWLELTPPASVSELADSARHVARQPDRRDPTARTLTSCRTATSPDDSAAPKEPLVCASRAA